MLLAMLIMTLGFWMYGIAVVLARLRCIIREREWRASMTRQFEGPASVGVA
jgi:uncharacterized membrane protein